MKINDKIHACRKKSGMSQEALAEKIGVSRQSISKWETGEALPEITKLPLLAQTFGVSTDWLLREEEEPQEEKSADEPAPAAAASAAAWPAWVENLPGFLCKAVKKFGWLYGVRLAIGGGLFAAFGLLMRAVSSSFMRSVNNYDPFGELGFGSSMSSVTWYDEMGNVIAAPEYAGSMLESIGLGGPAGYSVSSVVTPSGPFNLISGFVIFFGLAMLVTGVVLAVLLKKWGEKEA